MKTAILASLVAAAAAFAPAKVAQTSTSLRAASPYEEELGVIAPTGFFDPLNLSRGIDQEKFDKYRLAELKHGRVAMLAVCGYVVQEACQFPGELSFGLKFADVPNGLDALSAVPVLGWAQIFIGVALVEVKGTDETDGALGKFEQGQLNLPDDIMLKRKLCELQHGRIAMLAIAELVRHDFYAESGDKLITGLPFLY